MSLVLSYNFNENDTTDVRDYSGNLRDGAGTSLTIAASSRVGNECRFDGANDYIEKTSFTALNGAANFGLHTAVSMDSFPGVSDTILCTLPSTFTVWITTSSTIKCTVYTSGVSNGTVESSVLSTSTYYDVDITYDGSDLKIYIDETLDDTDSAITGNLANATDSLQIAADVTGGADFSTMYMNEIKIYSNSLSTDNIASLVNEQNGVSATVDPHTTYAVGDILASRTEDSNREVYAVVTHVTNQNTVRLQPLEDSGGTMTKLLAGDYLYKTGHFWDTAEQEYLEVTETGLRYYGDVDQVSDIGNADRVKFSVTSDGVLNNWREENSDYTLTAADYGVIVDTSGGVVTITLPASPVKWKEYIIKDHGSAASNNLTIARNGKLIDGSASNITVSTDYEVNRLVYDGTEWWKIT